MASLAVLGPSLLFRAGLAALLSTMGFEAVEEAADLGELKRRVHDARRPEMLLINLQNGDAGLATLIQEIKEWAPDTKLVFLAPDLDMQALSACFAAGAAGYLLENISRDGLQHSLRLVGAGQKVFPSGLANVLSTASSKFSGLLPANDVLRSFQLTDREIDVLRCVANGESNRFIGKKLGISEAVVSTHIKHILKKLRLSNRTQAALWGVARGLAAPFAALTRLAETMEGEKTEMELKDKPAPRQH